jgi:low temperature requirement protein LtrA
MRGRDIHESHRVSTPLELLFDLTFVVAIAAAASQLHHAAAEQHLAQGLVGFATTFFAIWWAWMTFTWFASAYDTDDAPYRLLTMVQMVGVLVLAAGVPGAAQGDFTTITMGYVVMRAGLIALWARAALEHPERRRTCLRYAIGIAVVQALWVARLLLPASMGLVSFVLLALVEIAIPIWAARAGHTPWHAHHIAERYGLFTIIVLGECVLGATNAVSGVIKATGWSWNVALVGFGSTSLILSLWWVYFLVPSGRALHEHRDRAFRWGYGHAAVFLSLAALGAFLEVVADQLQTRAGATGADVHLLHPMSPTYAIALVAGAVTVYLLSVWWMSAQVTRSQAGLKLIWMVGVLLPAAVVVAVWQGLPLPWAIPALTLAPLFVVLIIERGEVGRPERFAVR